MFKMRSSDYKKRNLPDFRHKYSKTFYQEIVHVVDGECWVKNKAVVTALLGEGFTLMTGNEKPDEMGVDIQTVAELEGAFKEKNIPVKITEIRPKKSLSRSESAKRAWAARKKRIKKSDKKSP